MPDPSPDVAVETDQARIDRIRGAIGDDFTVTDLAADDLRWLLSRLAALLAPIDRDAAYALYDNPKREGEFTPAEIVGLAQANHMWINAFSLIRPKPEHLQEIGAWVVRELQGSPIRDDLVGLSKVVYLRVNAS